MTIKKTPYLGLTILFVMLVASIWAGYVYSGEMPNPKLTTGHARTVDVHTLCTTSTKLVRNVPAIEKKNVYMEYGLAGNHTGYCDGAGGCEVDHLISLELGGSNDIDNLWVQPYFGDCNAYQKDALENKLHELICNGTLTIEAAQQAITDNWETAYTKYVDSLGCKPYALRLEKKLP